MLSGPGYSQNDGRWKNTPLGFSGNLFLGMKNGVFSVAAGCYVTACAELATMFGHPIDPPGMNELLKQRGLIGADGSIIGNDILGKLYDDIEFINRTNWWTEPTPLNFFDFHGDDRYGGFVKIDTNAAAGIQEHWLTVLGWDGGGDIIVLDPWDGLRKGLSAYANKEGTTVPKIIYAGIIYRKKLPPAPAPPPQPEPAPAPPPAPAPAPPEPAPAPQNPTPPLSTDTTVPATPSGPVITIPSPEAPQGDPPVPNPSPTPIPKPEPNQVGVPKSTQVAIIKRFIAVRLFLWVSQFLVRIFVGESKKKR